jgi:hypothetical protein
MFYTNTNNQELFNNFEKIGLQKDVKSKNILIKINLSGTYSKNHPRTDMNLLKLLVEYIYENDGNCALAEGSNSYLFRNLVTSGFENFINYYKIKIIDVDLVDYEETLFNGENHYIPKCFNDYNVRIAIPATSKRKDMLYSNNVKLFVGAVPRKMYQNSEIDVPKGVPRHKLHLNLDFSIANLFSAIRYYSPFHYYLNGGLSYNENIGEFNLIETFIGNDAVELDCHLFQKYFSDCKFPEYLNILNTG